MIEIRHDGRQVAVVLHQVRSLPARVLPAAARGLARGLQATVARAQTGYLQGPRPAKLGERTGRLLRSITSRVDLAPDRAIGRAGTNVVYGGIHEFGGTIHRTVKPGVVRLRTNADGTLMRQADGRLAVFARTKHKRAREVAYEGGTAYDINIRPRPYIRPALADTAPIIIGEILKEISTLSSQPPAS